MRLLFCIDHFGSGGAQRQLVTLAVGLQQRGHSVEFFIYQPEFRHFAPVVEDAGIPVHVFRKSRKYSPMVPVALARLTRRSGFDAVLAFLPTPSLYAELASLLMPSTPLVVSERFMYTSLSVGDRLLQHGHRLADRITVNSHHQREKMTSSFRWMARKISTIYNGVDLTTFTPRMYDEVGVRRANEHAYSLRLLTVASTAPKKNALGLVRALAELKASDRPVPQVSWAGSSGNSAADTAYKRTVDEELEALGLAEHWRWLGERADVPYLMRTHDALVHPSFYEGLPNAVCEALAAGLPVLASAVCDHPRLVTPGERGFLFDPQDPRSIAEAITEFAELGSQKVAVMGQSARRFAEQELSLERYTIAYEALFQDAINRRRAVAVGATA